MIIVIFVLMKNKINIAFVSHFPHYKMGGQKSMLALIENLNRKIFNPIVFLTELGDLSEYLGNIKIPFQVIPLKPLKPKHILDHLRNILLIRKNIKTQNINILHPDFERDALLFGIAKKFTQAKLVWHVRLTRPTNQDKMILRLADRVIGISEGCRKRFDSKLIKDKYLTIFNGLDCTLFSPPKEINKVRDSLSLPKNKIIVGFVGQMKESKGIEELISAIYKINKLTDNYYFILIGDFLDENYQRYILTKLDNIENAFHIPHQKDIIMWMQAMDLLLLTSHEGSEGMGRVLFEAMATETAVIGTDISGIRDAITTETGYLIREKNPQAIVDAILKITNSKDELEKFKKNGRKRALEVFDIKIHARNIEKVYLDLLDIIQK